MTICMNYTSNFALLLCVLKINLCYQVVRLSAGMTDSIAEGIGSSFKYEMQLLVTYVGYMCCENFLVLGLFCSFCLQQSFEFEECYFCSFFILFSVCELRGFNILQSQNPLLINPSALFCAVSNSFIAELFAYTSTLLPQYSMGLTYILYLVICGF